jgi:hypothetical protein
LIEGTIIPINDKNGIGESKIIIFRNKNPWYDFIIIHMDNINNY